MSVPITPALVSALLPSQTLADVLTDPHDLDNDLHVLLDWLLPFFCDAGAAAPEPLARVKAAARRCLKDRSVHAEFVRLFLNSIGEAFRARFAPLVDSPVLLRDIAAHVRSLNAFYARQLSLLNLSSLATQLFHRGLNSLYLRYLDRPAVLRLVEAHLQHCLDNLAHVSLADLARVGLAPIIQQLMVSISTDKIRSYVVATCAHAWDVPVLQRLSEWVRVDLYPVFALGCVDAFAVNSSSDLVRIAHDELVALRIHEIYDMTRLFPLSATALGQLHLCLVLENGSYTSQTQQRGQLVDYFVQECHLRLLHLGSNTVQIVVFYIKTIKTFLLIDHTGVLLDKVARPIRKYLKTRSDLVSQLVKGMLDPDPASNPLIELARELHLQRPPLQAAVDDLTDLEWCPDPIDALPDFKKGKVSDVIEALTSIFPLPSVFTEEFTRLFGERLLQWDKYSAKSIVQFVDLLKSRFGANEFATLDVMIKDIQDSHALNRTINLRNFKLTVLSKMYWPTVIESLSQNDYFTIPSQADVDAFCGSFKAMKKNRDLALIPSLGSVAIELTFKQGVREFNVTPAQATVIELFHDDFDNMSLLTISLATGMASYVATQALRFWVNEEVLIESDGAYRVND